MARQRLHRGRFADRTAATAHRFQGATPARYHDSIHARLFSLPDITRALSGHDYRGNSVSTIGWEKRRNARLANRDRAGFIELMGASNCRGPRCWTSSLPANRHLGIPHMPPDTGDRAAILARAEARGCAGGVAFRGNLMPAGNLGLVQGGEIELVDTRTWPGARSLVGYVPGKHPDREWYDYPAKKRNEALPSSSCGQGRVRPAGGVPLPQRRALEDAARPRGRERLRVGLQRAARIPRGDKNAQGQRVVDGWRVDGLPWRQD